ncbi:transcriptional regulator, TetR family [Brevibacterium sp. 239c]|nr:transcriptional regulator, TetR family [Brevibacterium sp. 239c]
MSYDAEVSESSMPSPARTRRRGAELESALLQAAWDELSDVGYAGFTMESVATRARTGIAVLYRRWSNKDDLALAAFEHYREAHPITVPDSGSLRGDLIGLLERMGRQRAGFFSIAFGGAFSGLLNSTGLSLTQFRDRILGAQRTENLIMIYQRAHDRGEIDLNKISGTVLDMPVDLVRHDILMDPNPVERTRIEAIVDEVLLPLVLPTGRG